MLFSRLQIKTVQLFCQEWQPNTQWNTKKLGRCQRHRNCCLAACLCLYFGQDIVVEMRKKHKHLRLSQSLVAWFTGGECSRRELPVSSAGRWWLTQTSTAQGPDPKRWKSSPLSEAMASERLCSKWPERVKESVNLNNSPCTLYFCAEAFSLPFNTDFSILIYECFSLASHMHWNYVCNFKEWCYSKTSYHTTKTSCQTKGLGSIGESKSETFN